MSEQAEWKFGDVLEEKPPWGTRRLMVTHYVGDRAFGLCILAIGRDGDEPEWTGRVWIIDEDAKKINDD